MTKQNCIRMLLVGRPGTELFTAAEMARGTGAEVVMADTPTRALAMLRTSAAGLVMVDVELDVAGFMARLRAERFAVPVLACGIDASATQAVAAIRAGARDYVPLPPQRDLIAAAITSVVCSPAVEMVGEHPALERATALALAIAPSRAPVLVSGEKGVGKEVMARAIHDASGRRGRFLVVECAGVSAEVAESELFGHEADAFPAAVAQRLGSLEEAAEGTLFLRDIDCLAGFTQAKLVAALQEGATRRLGGHEPVPITARLVASTSSNLDQRVSEGAFRADLLARLRLMDVAIPPLRERVSDIPLLARSFAGRLAAANALPLRAFDEDALALLGSYAWPGNIRELEDVVHRALLLAQGSEITTADIVLIDGSRIAPPDPAPARIEVEALVGRTVEEVERELILHTLEHCHGNRTSASSILGISVRTMRNKLKSFIESGIPVAPAA